MDILDVPNSTNSFEEEFKRRLLQGINKKERGEISPPLFTYDDLTTNNKCGYLDKMLRTICITQNVTKESWNQLSVNYSMFTMGMTTLQAHNKTNNVLKAVTKAPITNETFSFFTNALGLTLRKLSMEFEDADGVVHKYDVDV